MQLGEQRIRLHARQCAAHHGKQRVLVVAVRADPAGVQLGLARGLEHVAFDALAIVAQPLFVEPAGRQRAQQRLQQQGLVGARGHGLGPRRARQLWRRAEAAQPQPPCGRHFAEHVQPCTHVLGALAVVRGGGQDGVRPVRGAVGVRPVQAAHGHAERARVAADLVQRDEPAVAVEGRVLHTLGGHRRAELLEAQREAAHAFAQAVGRTFLGLRQQRTVHEVEDGRIGGVPAAPRLRHGPVDVAPVLRRGLVHDVGAVHRHACRHFGQRLAQRVERVVARAPVGACDAQQLAGQHRQLRGERAALDGALAVVREFVEVLRLAAEAAPDAVHARARGAIDEHPVGHVGEAIAGGAVQRPALRHVLVRRGDLLGHHVQRPRRAAVGLLRG